jgi:serine/threonine protein kinase
MVDEFETIDQIFLVLEYLEGGDLFDYLKSRDFKTSQSQQFRIMEGIASAVQYLHGIGVIHRDLKLENVMMSSNTDQAQPRLVDFGLSIILGAGQTQCEIYGTEGYMSPEMYYQKPYYKEVDMWSLGILYYAIISGFMPFEQEDIEKIVKMTNKNFINFEPV